MRRRFAAHGAKSTAICAFLLMMLCFMPGCYYDDVELAWAQGLSAENISAIEAVSMSSPEDARYKMFDTADYERIAALINEAKGVRLDKPDEVTGGSLTFYVTLADGERHTFAGNADTYMVIDGVSYEVDTHWLKRWGGEPMDGPVPEGFEL